jgi:hypothetical protein
MSRRKQLAVAACALAAVAVAGWLALRPSGPTHEGRTVEEWFEELLPGSTNKVAAERAFVQLGTNAVPYLITVLEQRETAVHRFRLRHHQTIPSWLNRVLPRLRLIEREQDAALRELQRLGPEAQAAAPAICALLRYHCEQAGPIAPFAWSGIITPTGGRAVPRASGLGVQPTFARCVTALRDIGGEDREIILSLLEAARTEPVLVISRFKHGAPPALAPTVRNTVPELLSALDDPFTCVVAERLLEWVEPDMPAVAEALARARQEVEEPLKSLMGPPYQGHPPRVTSGN